MADPNQGQSIAAAWEAKVGTKPEDNVHYQHWLLYQLQKGSGFKGVDGGRKLEISLEYAVNTTFKSYDDTETLDTTRIDVFDCAQYDWAQIAGTVVISDKEKAFNQGSGGKFDLLAGKLENADSSHDREINRQMFLDGTGNGGKDLGGLTKLIPAVPTTGTVGGINRAVFSFWRTQTQSGANGGTAYDNLPSAMRTCYNACSGGVNGEHPSFGVTTSTIFQAYEGKLVALEQIVSKSDADLAFANESIQFKGMKLAYDEQHSPAASIYFLNPKFLKLYYQKGYWKKMRDPIRPANQTVDIYQIETIAQLGLSASRRVGIVHTIT